MKTPMPALILLGSTRSAISAHSQSRLSRIRGSVSPRHAPPVTRLGVVLANSNLPYLQPVRCSKVVTESPLSCFTHFPNSKLARASENSIRYGTTDANKGRPLCLCQCIQAGSPERVTAKVHDESSEPIQGTHSKIQNRKSANIAFTLIELMAATTVLSVVLLMMVGMQDQMSKAWSNANRRTDATREGRAACRLMARDFSYFLVRGTNVQRNFMRAPSVMQSPVPFYYFSGTGGIPSPSLSMPSNAIANSSYIFGVFPKKKSSSNDSDFSLVGYYIAQTNSTNVNGFTSTNCNLYRYYRTSNDAIVALSNWISAPTPQPNNLFPNISTASDEILARNACNLSIQVYGSTNSKNGLIYSNNYGASAANGIYQGNKIHVELSLYPEEIAQKLPNISTWTNINNIRSARTFEFNVDWYESKE